MLKSINLWAFPYPERMTLRECMQLAKDADFDGIELKNVFKLAPASVHDNKVWVNDGGELDIRPVNIAFRSAEYVLIDRGLNDGESIVTSNLGSPVNRMAIRTNESTPPSPTPAAVKP